ncbi:MAG: c-type cytochrome [Pseudohongiellaceae bacterium]
MNTVWKNTRAAALPSALLLVAWVLAAPALAQPAADNIQPVGAVCLAGQACVGQPVAGSGSAGQPAAAPAANAAPAPAAQQSAPADPAPAQQSTPADPAPAASAPVDTASAGASDFDPAATYNQFCMACHMTGAAGAPQLDDEEAWTTRLEKGMDAVMQNVVNGIGAMPARGICNDCSDEQLRAIVDYMVSQ